MVDGPYGGINMQRYLDGDRLLVVAGGSGAGWILPFIELFHRRISPGCCCAPAKEYAPSSDSEDKEAQTDRRAGKRSVSGPQKLRVILATRDTSSRIWFLKTVGELLARCSTPKSPDFDVEVHLTGEAEKNADMPKQAERVTVSPTSETSSDNIHVNAEGHDLSVPGHELGGRPDLPVIVHEEGSRAAEAGQSLSVFVCGPLTMQNDVRNAVAAENLAIIKGSKSDGVYLHSEHFSWA